MSLKTKILEQALSNGVTVKNTVDENGLTIDSSYWINEDKLAVFNLDSKIAKKLEAYNLIARDLRTVLRWQQLATELLEKHPFDPWTEEKDFGREDEFIRGLFTSSVITYGKCFASGKKRGAKLEMRHHVNKELHNLHTAVINTRNKFVAHSDSDEYEIARALLVVDLRKDEEVKYINMTHVGQLHSISYHGLEFIDLVNNVLSNLNSKMDTLTTRLGEELNSEKMRYYKEEAKKQLGIE